MEWVRHGTEWYSCGVVASGFAELIVDADLNNREFGPRNPIVRNSGGAATDWHGNALTTASHGRIIAAGDPRLFKKAYARLRS